MARTALREIPRRDPFPGFVQPMLATLSTTVPSGDQWLHEIKFDGYRTQAHRDGGGISMFSRRGFDWSHRFANVTAELEGIRADSFILDGEMIAAGSGGMANFSALQADLRRGQQDRLAYYVFDLLYLDGFDLRSRPLIERKRLLAGLLADVTMTRVFFSEHFEIGGEALFQQARTMALEGIVSKRADSRYRSDRGRAWLKIKVKQRSRFPIIGFVPAPGAVAALHLARPDGSGLAYAGTAKTGFARLPSQLLRGFLDKIIQARPAVDAGKKPDSKWVKPTLWAEIEYQELTPEGKVRHASFKGLYPSNRPDAKPLVGN